MSIQDFELDNFGPITKMKGQKLGKLNLIIGKNSTGKTYLLKTLYSLIRTQEEAQKGDDPRHFNEVLADKLYWTFQNEKLGDLVSKGTSKLSASMGMADKRKMKFEFGTDTTKKVTQVEHSTLQREANSIFLPPKEILSLQKIILKSALQDRVFGFDATYVDLALALQGQPQRGRNYDAFSNSRTQLEQIFTGKVTYNIAKSQWQYKQGNKIYSIHATAEGIKKIAILDTLLGNRYLTPSSVIFIDEPESALHPKAIVELLDIIKLLADAGIQFFMATHSYFVIKKLYLIALENKMSIPIFTNSHDSWQQEDLLNGIPDNEIINESVRLFDQELEVSFNG